MSTSSQKSMPRQAVILFSDIIHSSVFSDTLGLIDYDMFLEEFQKTMFDVQKRVFKLTQIDQSKIEFDIRGDEACVILYTDDTSNNLHTALMMASYMKSLWFQSSFNIKRVSEAKIAADIAIGIHTGKVIVRPRVSKNMPPKPEGYAINLAKRIEGLSREGTHTKMMISHDVHILMKQFNIDIEITRRITKQFQGILYPIHVYEIINFPANFYRTDAYAAKTNRR